MGAIFEYLKSAIASIRGNRVRSFLTMLGIIIGIMSVLVILVVGDGVEAQMKQDLGRAVTSVNIKLLPSKTDKFITKEAYRLLGEAFEDQSYGLDTSWQQYGMTETYRGKEVYVSLTGRGEAGRKLSDIQMIAGRYFTLEDVYNGEFMCVMPQCAAKALLGYEDVVGQTINFTIGDKSYDVNIVGIRKDTDSDLEMIKWENYSADIPYTALMTMAGADPDAKLTSVKVVVDKEVKDELSIKAPAALENILDIRGQKAVKLESNDGMGAMGGILSMIKSVVILIAAISLVVGGIGVMNIMTVTVTERTREIGIRKSLGARTSSIMVQFLSEAAILTGIGGFVGLALGLGLAYVATKLADVPYAVDFSSVAIVVGISIFIGLFFGIAPAHKAAKLNPIDALHQD